MCGIVGSLSITSKKTKISKAGIEKMRDSMIHRGPDGAGVWMHPKGLGGLAHRRLAILELNELAAQPMISDDETVVLTFNGEIYNHLDVRKKMGDFINWRTKNSDTETVLRAYEMWGINCLEHFRGMFALCIWDEKVNKVFLVRDRIGIKPLYYSEVNGKFNFASEIKALLEDSDQPREVNEQGLFDYLSFLTVPAPNTLFRGIYKLEPGTYLEVCPGSGLANKVKYYEVLDNITEPAATFNEIDECKKILAQLREAVSLRALSDVPVGVFLSGGIDSSSNAALLSQVQENKVRAFSIGYDGDYETYVNELGYASQAAEHVGAIYKERKLTQTNLIDFLPLMTKLQDEPIADPVCVPVYYVSKLARDSGVIVCQVGEGADELFIGYPGWKTKYELQKLANVPFTLPVKKALARLLVLLGKDKNVLFEALIRSARGQPVFWGGAEAFTDKQKKKLLSKSMREKIADRTSWDSIKPIHDRFKTKDREGSTLNWMTYLDLNLRLPELLLMRVDKMSMGVSLEARVPFLDHKMVELALSLPSKRKIKSGRLKHLLKEAVSGLIPDSIINRKKQGFGVPVYEWLFDELGDKIEAEIEEFCKRTDYIDLAAFKELFAAKPGAQVWYLYNFVLWWNMFIKPTTSHSGKQS